MKPAGYASYYPGVVIDVAPDDNHTKEWHEVLVDIPGLIKGVPAFPFRDELDEPKVGDKVMVLDLDPLFHSYFMYRKVKEDKFIGFRSSGKSLSITPENITIGTFEEDTNYKEDEVPESLRASLMLDSDGNIELKAEEVIRLNGNAGTSEEPSIVANGGNNGGMVNVRILKQLITAISEDLIAAGSGAHVSEILGQVMDMIEDKKFKH